MIESIDFTLICNSEKQIIINLRGKNLILTGQNGCGKTLLLKQLFNYLQRLFNADLHNRKNIQQQLRQETGQYIEISETDSLLEVIKNNQFILRFFEANRFSQIAGPEQIESISNIRSLGKTLKFDQDSSGLFEKYLVSYYNFCSHLIARENNPKEEQQINEWFDKVQDDLRDLFEDSTLILKYNPEHQAFYIIQQDKVPYRLGNLSSGYSSIMSIYADLLMKVELRNISPEEITGFVLIDEIDAHLHVSIQRKIFSFFDKAFPKIQFIVTTHSPFVVQSVNDSIIYDLSKLELLEDLSMYSYESILKGLLGVESTSDILNKKLDEMASIVQQEPLNKGRLKELVDSIEPHEAQLNPRSRAFLLLGKNALLDSNDGSDV
ncbi:TPA: AAA family ATPase [Vibrio diabolicus]